MQRVREKTSTEKESDMLINNSIIDDIYDRLGLVWFQRMLSILIIAMFSAVVLIFFVFRDIAKAEGGYATYAEMVAYMQQEVGDLPSYCQCRKAEQRFKKDFVLDGYPWPKPYEAMRNKWIKIFKNDWTYLHHYCNGLMRMNEASGISNRKTVRNKEAVLKNAIGEFDFIRKSASRNFPLLYQLYMYKYQIYIQLNEQMRAQRALMRAQAIKNRKRKR